jgi:hypothetical protein
MKAFAGLLCLMVLASGCGPDGGELTTLSVPLMMPSPDPPSPFPRPATLAAREVRVE